MFGNLVNTVLTWLTFFIDLILGNSPGTMVDPYMMADDMLLKVQAALYVSDLTYKESAVDLEDTEVFDDQALDRALVRFDAEDDTCYIGFRGSTGSMMDDVQSFSFFPQRVCGGAGCCWVNSGLKSAYNAEFVGAMETSLDECVQRCDGGCDVVLAGHSQGGSIATVAAIVLADYNPILITYGQHPAAWFGCDVLDNMETYLRFSASCDTGGGNFAYDTIPHIGTPFANRHSGTMIMLGETGAATVAINKDRTFMPTSMKCHYLTTYGKAVNQLSAGPLEGFDDGARCTLNVECKSRQCSMGSCASL